MVLRNIKKVNLFLCLNLIFSGSMYGMQQQKLQVVSSESLVFDKNGLCDVSGKVLQIQKPFTIVSKHYIKRVGDSFDIAFYAYNESKKNVTELSKGDQVLFDKGCFLKKKYNKNIVKLISKIKDPEIKIYRTDLYQDLVLLKDSIGFAHVMTLITLFLTYFMFFGQNNK